ncbi:MAG: hypothetical protein WD850_03115 [Candidatus Spechtbacterales bacterium]
MTQTTDKGVQASTPPTPCWVPPVVVDPEEWKRLEQAIRECSKTKNWEGAIYEFFRLHHLPRPTFWYNDADGCICRLIAESSEGKELRRWEESGSDEAEARSSSPRMVREKLALRVFQELFPTGEAPSGS